MFDKETKSKFLQLVSILFNNISGEYPQLLNSLSEKTFTKGETGIAPRVLTEWGKLGLLIAPYEKSSHAPLTVSEFVWIKLVERMREFNFSTEFILNVKAEVAVPLGDKVAEFMANPEITDMITQQFGPAFSVFIKPLLKSEEGVKKILNLLPINLNTVSAFDLIIMLCLVYQTPFTINLDRKGISSIFSPLFYSVVDMEEYVRKMQHSHVTLSISEVLAEALSIAPMDKVYGKLQLVTEQEAAVLDALKQKNLKSVKVRFNDKEEMDLLEVTKEQKVDRRTRLLEVIMMDGYHDIELTTVKGSVVKCVNTRKVKLK